MNRSFIILLILVSGLSSCRTECPEVGLYVIDPGHFHAALVQKNMLDGVSDTVRVYASAGKELDQYLMTMKSFSERKDDPVSWVQEVHSGEGYLEALPEEGNGNVVVLSGNNKDKSEYISLAVDKGYNVLTDKPMSISVSDFDRIVDAYEIAEKESLIIYDLMTERYDILNQITRMLLSDIGLFGAPDGSVAPAVWMKSVHHFYKMVAGEPVVRPEWYYDVHQQGEGIADVTTHLIDLVFWQCFPEQPVRYEEDIVMTSSEHWPTLISKEMYAMSTGAEEYPEYLMPCVRDGILEVMSNGRLSFCVKGISVSMEVRWDFTPEEGKGDTFEALYRGTKALISVVQDTSTGFVKQLYVCPASGYEDDFMPRLQSAMDRISDIYPFVSARPLDDGRYLVCVPVEERLGHEEHFNKVAQTFLRYVRGEARMPEWETANTLSKYYVTSQAVMLADEK